MRWFVLLLAAVLLLHEDVSAQAQHGFRISFSDKRGTSGFNNPNSLLSPRSLDRRASQGIALDSTDLPVSPVYIDSVINLTGGVFHLKSDWFNYCVLLLNDSAHVLNLQGQDFITGIEYIAYYSGGLHMKADTQENEKFKGEHYNGHYKTTGDETFYGQSFQQTRLVNGDYLHDRKYMGQGMLIAVCDEGFQYVDVNPGFDSMRRSGRLVDTYNFPRADANPYVQGTHGTSSLSTMAGYLPGTYVGSAPLAQYALYNTEFPGEQPIEMDNLVAAMERADSIGADIISVSLGYNKFEGPGTNPLSFSYQQLDGHTTLVAKGANIATKKGMLFVASAGNEGANAQWPYILTPGDADSAITVGSVDPNGTPAGNSGKGPNASGRVKPDVSLQGQPAIVMNFNENPTPAAGTSFAAPQLAGWAACLWQATSKGTPYLIRTAVIQSASRFNDPTHPQLGYGIPDFSLAMELLDIKDTPAIPSQLAWLQGNPVHHDIQLQVYLQKAGNIGFLFTDITGRVVLRQEQSFKGGMHTLSFPAGAFSPGMYFLTVISDEQQVTLRMVKN